MTRLGGVARLAVFAARGLVVALCLVTLVVHARLYREPGAEEIRAQLRFVRGALDRGEARHMQALFPEGFLFSHVLHGLAWIDQALAAGDDPALRRRAITEARLALDHATSAEGKAAFSEAMAPRFGVFYAGWTNWLRAGLVLITDAADRDPALLAELGRHSSALAAAFSASPTPFLASYPDQAWPVDSAVAVASLRLHDQLLPPRFEAVIARWLARAKARLDPTTGLLPHRVDPRDGRPLETARGSSQSVLARFLLEIEPGWAREQYAQFRRHLVTTRLGLPGVREFPAGVPGEGDVDSGPLVFDISMSATVVTRGAAAVHGDTELASALAGTMEFFGLPLGLGGEKCYAFGVLPVGDAFIAWAHGARAWTKTAKASDGAGPTSHPRLLAWLWRWPSHAIAAALLGPLLWLCFRKRTPKGPPQA